MLACRFKSLQMWKCVLAPGAKAKSNTYPAYWRSNRIGSWKSSWMVAHWCWRPRASLMWMSICHGTWKGVLSIWVKLICSSQRLQTRCWSGRRLSRGPSGWTPSVNRLSSAAQNAHFPASSLDAWGIYFHLEPTAGCVGALLSLHLHHKVSSNCL